MLLPGFQNFPAKCPKSEIFLRDFPASRQKKKTIGSGPDGTHQLLLQLALQSRVRDSRTGVASADHQDGEGRG